MEILTAIAASVTAIAAIYEGAVTSVAAGTGSRFPIVGLLAESLPEAAVLLLACVVLVLSRRVRRTRAALGGMTTELESMHTLFTQMQSRQQACEERVSRLHCEFTDLHTRQRSLESRLGKPDPKLAAAMSRAGTRPQHMVDCGLSHSEVHLLQALSAAKRSDFSAEAAL